MVTATDATSAGQMSAGQMSAGQVSAQVADIELALRALVAAPPVAELAATEVVRLLALRALLATAISDRLSQVEAGNSWARDGSVTPAAWLRRAVELSRAEASSQLRLARRLRDLPLVRAALADAQLSAEHARVLAAHLSNLPADLRDSQEQPFIEVALLTDPHTLDIELRKRCQALQPLPADTQHDRQHSQRRLSLRQTFGGMWQLSGLLDPDNGELLSVALTALRRTDQHTGDQRTPSQRDADALIHLARTALDSGALPTAHRVRPHLLISCTIDSLQTTDGTPLASYLTSGQPIRPNTLAKLGCDATLTRLVLDPEGRVLDVGRSQRTAPAHIWWALQTTHPGCWADGCDEPVPRTQAHHAQPWSEGGDTSLANSVLLCLRRGGHHDQIHHGHAIRLRDGRWLGAHGYLPTNHHLLAA